MQYGCGMPPLSPCVRGCLCHGRGQSSARYVGELHAERCWNLPENGVTGNMQDLMS